MSTAGGSVTDVKVAVTDLSGNSVTANSATFTDLTVSGTATFNATEVVADSLKIGGKTVETIANEQIAAIAESTVTSSATGITVGVTTKGGSVTAVSVDASSFGNVMHFAGVVTELPSEGKAGDIVVIGAGATGGLVQGQEYIYNGDAWELIGDQKSYALNAYTSTATVYSGVATVPGALNAAGAAIDTINGKVSTLESAVTGGTDADGLNGVNVTVTTAAKTAVPTVAVTIEPSYLNTTLGTTEVADKTVATTIGEGSDTALATTSAVKAAITAATLVWLNENGTEIA